MAPYTTVSTTTTLPAEEIPRLEGSSSNKTTNARTESPQNNKTEDGCKSLVGTYGAELKWIHIVPIVALHAAAVVGLIIFPYRTHLRLILWAFAFGGLNGLGVTAGAHRLWCHRSYKAKLPLRIFLMLCFCMAAQNNLYDWVRDHRVHHRHTETDADPHNSKRGFFFAHVGWLMMKKHPDVISRGKEIDMTDILADPVVQFHMKYFYTLRVLFGFLFPTLIPTLLWGENFMWSGMVIGVGRYCLSLNFTWLVNSAAHIWGKRPYDNKISPAENLTVAILAMGEGWHNYHHTFPWDYKTSELGIYRVNITTFWIDLFGKLGWAYDLKTPSERLLKTVIAKHGDGTHPVWGHEEIPESAEAELLENENSQNKKID